MSTDQTTTTARPAPPTLKVVTGSRTPAKKASAAPARKAPVARTATKAPAKKAGTQTAVQPPRVTPKLLAELKKRWHDKIVGKHRGDIGGLVARTSPEASKIVTTRELLVPERKLLLEGPSDTMTQQSALKLQRLLAITMKRPVVQVGSGRPKTGRSAWDPTTRTCIGLRPGQTVSKAPKPGVIANGPNFQPKGPSVHGVVVPNKKKDGKKK